MSGEINSKTIAGIESILEDPVKRVLYVQQLQEENKEFKEKNKILRDNIKGMIVEKERLAKGWNDCGKELENQEELNNELKAEIRKFQLRG